MSKTPSIKLFNLIKALSGSEKRYFKIFVAKQSDKDNKYIRLFEAIDTQDSFDDDALKEVIYGHTKIESRKYSALKAYLYELILKALQGYDENSSVDFKLKGMLQNIRVLFKRSFFDDAKEMVYKTKKLATRYESFSTLLELLSWEKRIAYTETNISFLDRELDRINTEEIACLDELKQISEYRSIFFKVLISLRKDASRDEAQKAKLQAHLDNPLYSQVSPSSHHAKILRLRGLALLNYAVSDYQSFHANSKQLVALFEEKPFLLKEDQSEYISSINNYAMSCGFLWKHAEMRDCLDKLFHIRPNNIDDRAKILRQYFMNKLRLCINSGEFEEGLNELKRLDLERQKIDDSIFRKSTFYLQYFSIYFGTEDYEQALLYLNEWLNLPGSVERKDLQSLSRILNLIIHYEMKNEFLLDSLIRSTYRFLKRKGDLQAFERLIYDFVKQANHQNDKKELQLSIENIKNEFERLAAIPSIKVTLDMFDFRAWLESKTSKSTFAQVVKAKYLDELAKMS